MQAWVWKNFRDSQAVAMSLKTVKGYMSNDPEREFFKIMEHKLGKKVAPPDPINRCESPGCDSKKSTPEERVDIGMRRIAAKRGLGIAVLPDVTFVHVRNPKGDDLAYSIILNKGYSNITSMFESEDNRDRSQDTLTVIKGLEGSYPNFFFSFDIDQMDDFVQRFISIKNNEDYERFVGLYGVRRTDSDFWQESDWFFDWAQKNKPLSAGIYDYNRYRDQ